MSRIKLPKGIVHSIVAAVLVMLLVMTIAVWQEWDLSFHLWTSLGAGIIVYVITLFFLDFYKK
ncbi:hypothetical protein KKE06_03510 [Candidatus Micrarchaeota archaeon]|nr:hypothetical protein [Candidatus Micrarchaeota archaeon]MBU1930959.1 hypothetical protein [Candidatus Micrarchaeota archaeon]